MIDVEDVLRDELERFAPVMDSTPDWNAVVAGSGLRRKRLRVRAAAASALVLAAAVLGLTTPLGSALAHGLNGFSAWLTGEPGTPASKRQQHAFNGANARSWVSFPKGTQLRHLITEDVGPTRVELLGFRSGSSAFCLRVIVQGMSRSSTQSCASLADVRLAGSPVRVVIVDHPVGKGDKSAWYGIDHLHSANLQITAGITDDSVRSVTLRDNQGSHQVQARSNAFLYVARSPEVGQRVSAISARTASGTVRVAFAPSPFGGMGMAAGAPVTAPTVPIQRRVHGGKIAWLDRHEKRGQPLSVLPARIRRALLGYRAGVPGRTRVVFGRVLTPDPNVPFRVALTLNAHHAGGPAAGICIVIATVSGGGGGCSPYPGIFDNAPVTVGSFGNGPDEYVTADGVASDDVARLQAVLMTGQRLPVPLSDNAFIVNLPRAKLPARIVAYDRNGKVVGVSEAIQDFQAGGGRAPAPALGRARQLLAVHGPGGTHSELLVGRSTTGGECMYVRHYVSAHVAGVMEGCSSRTWSGSALQLETESTPPRFVFGRVRSNVASIRLRYADGTATTIRPTQGFVLHAMTAAQLSSRHQLVGADALGRNGESIAHESFTAPAPKP